MRFREYCLASIVVCSLGLTRDAVAESVTYNFSGTIESVYASGSATIPPDVSVGAAFTGSATFLLTSPSTISATYANYDGALVDLTFTIGSTSYTKALVMSYPRTSLSNAVSIENNRDVGSGMYRDLAYSYISSTNSTDPAHVLQRTLSLTLTDIEASPAALSSTAIPTGPLDLSKFITQHAIQFSDYDYNSSTFVYSKSLVVLGNIASIQLAPSSVPAPPAVAMLGLGLSLTIAWRRAGRPEARRDRRP